jgi:hypothetical protein
MNARPNTRRSLKFLHTVASCGLVGALGAYGIVLLYLTDGSPQTLAQARTTISFLSSYLLLPSMAMALVTGLFAMAAHRPYLETRWAWLKAILGLSVFEATLGIVQSKATTAAEEAAKLAAGAPDTGELSQAIAYEWYSLIAIFTLSMAQIALGIWRPRLSKR